MLGAIGYRLTERLLVQGNIYSRMNKKTGIWMLAKIKKTGFL
jgi:hypothetical protein